MQSPLIVDPHPPSREWPARAVGLGLVALVMLAGAAYALGVRLGTPTSDQLRANLPAAPTASAPPQATPLADLARSALSRTVTIEAVRSTDEEFGTGWLFDDHGDFVTNAHVVDGGLSIRIRDRLGNTHVGTLLGEDRTADIAVIRSNDGFAGPALAVSTRPISPSDEVVALASSRATGHSDITVERVGALHQDVPVKGNSSVSPAQVTTDTTVYHDMVNLGGSQIFPGNSGGPVLDRSGGVVGIVTLAGKADDQAYAIPLARVAAELSSFASRSR